MRDWVPNRACAYEDQFWTDLEGIGVSVKEFDDLSPSIDQALFGASIAKLDSVYPVLRGNARMILTDRFRSIPPLRVAFEIDAKGDIVYLGVSLR